MNNIRITGWYVWSYTSPPQNAPDNNWGKYGCSMYVVATEPNGYAIQTVYDLSDDITHGCAIQRTICPSTSGNIYYPWEWINPPMQLGTEYRTTERYLGKPVYTQIVQFDNLSTNQAFAPGGEIFRAIGEYQYPDSSGKYIPNMPTNPTGGTMTADSPYMEFGDNYNRTLRVQLKSDSQCLGKSARVQMWYTK